MFSRNTISTRLFNGYFIIIIFLGVITIVALVKLGSINYLKSGLTDDSRIRIECIGNLEIYIERLRTMTHRHTNKNKKKDFMVITGLLSASYSSVPLCSFAIAHD